MRASKGNLLACGSGESPNSPTKTPKQILEPLRLAAYIKLARQAYCQGDWLEADIDLIDLSGNDPLITARFIDVDNLPNISDRELRDFVETFVEAKRLADIERAKRPKKAVSLPMGELLDIE